MQGKTNRMSYLCQVNNPAIFLYTNNYLHDSDLRCKDSPRILVLRPLELHRQSASRPYVPYRPNWRK